MGAERETKNVAEFIDANCTFLNSFLHCFLLFSLFCLLFWSWEHCAKTFVLTLSSLLIVNSQVFTILSCREYDGWRWWWWVANLVCSENYRAEKVFKFECWPHVILSFREITDISNRKKGYRGRGNVNDGLRTNRKIIWKSRLLNKNGKELIFNE